MTLLGHTYYVYGLSFTPDGTLLASGGDTYVKIWDVATGLISYKNLNQLIVSIYFIYLYIYICTRILI